MEKRFLVCCKEPKGMNCEREVGASELIEVLLELAGCGCTGLTVREVSVRRREGKVE